MRSTRDHFAVDVRAHGASATIVAAGSLDLATADELRRAAGALRPGTSWVLVDLRGVDFIDSSGLGTLLNLRGELRRRGVRLSVAADDGAVRRAVETTGLGELLAA